MRLLTLLSTLFIAASALAGSPDEDPIARAYRDRFQAANAPSFAQVLLNRAGRTTNEYRGFWTNCHQRTLEDGNFNSGTTRYRFTQRTPEILIDSDRGQEFYFVEGELQNIRTIDVEVSQPNTEIKLKTKLRTITSIRVEANGNLILEDAFVPTDLAPYPEYGTLALGAGVRDRSARVSNYTVCQTKDLL